MRAPIERCGERVLAFSSEVPVWPTKKKSVDGKPVAVAFERELTREIDVNIRRAKTIATKSVCVGVQQRNAASSHGREKRISRAWKCEEFLLIHDPTRGNAAVLRLDCERCAVDTKNDRFGFAHGVAGFTGLAIGAVAIGFFAPSTLRLSTHVFNASACVFHDAADAVAVASTMLPRRWRAFA